MQYLVSMTTHVPDGTPEQEVDEVKAREAAHSAELAAQGNVLRLWRPPLRPGEWRTLGAVRRGRRQPARDGAVRDAAADLAER